MRVLVKNCNPAFIKIASMDLNNHQLLKFIAKKNLPIVLSTGMGTGDEINHAIKILKDNGAKKFCILHCVSLYPLDYKLANLNNIKYLKKKFRNIPIGFSDHSLGTVIPLAAIALGACLIEKHFTTDRNLPGRDNKFALLPEEFKKMTEDCDIVSEMFESGELLELLNTKGIEVNPT